MTPDEEAAHLAKVTGLAKTYYPGIVSDSRTLDGIVLGFLVTPEGRVLRHSAIRQSPPPVAVADELKRMFPERNRADLVRNGFSCILDEKSQKKKYCVAFAEVRK